MKRKPPAFHRPRRLEGDYTDAVDRLMRKWLDLPAFASLEDLQHALADLAHRGNIPEAARIVKGMVTAVAQEDAASWREAAAGSSKGRRIHDMLRRGLKGTFGPEMRGYLEEHARKISTLPQAIAQDASEYIATRQMRGERSEEIVKGLRRKLPEVSAARIDMLARTQVASTATALTRARATDLRLGWYEWDTSEDARVRASHRIMDLVLVAWADPPAPEALLGIKSKLGHYHAGNCPNCRCDANVLVDLDQVRWPHKVYTGGAIVRMRRSDFAALAGMAA